MHTYFLGKEQVRGYLLDLFDRLLRSLRYRPPTVAVSIGPSGLELVNEMLHLEPALAELELLRGNYDKHTKTVDFMEGVEEVEKSTKGAHVLIVDSAIHSGSTMRKMYEKVESFGPESISTYGLVLKRSSKLIPSFFGLLIEPHDRAYFLLDRIPNMRVMRSGCLRPLEEKDVSADPIDCGVESISKFDWADLWYELQLDGKRHTYVYEANGRLMGYVSFKLMPDGSLLIDVLAVDRNAKGQGVGLNLLRWAETCGRTFDCRRIMLWAIVEEIPMRMYVGNDYQFVPGKEMKFVDESYMLMMKDIVYDPYYADLLKIE